MKTTRSRTDRTSRFGVLLVILGGLLIVVLALAWRMQSNSPTTRMLPEASVVPNEITASTSSQELIETRTEVVQPSPSAEPVKGDGAIHVFVTDRAGQAVPEATVRLEIRKSDASEPDAPALETAADGKGTALFTELPWGKYRVSAQHEGEAGGALAHVGPDAPVSSVEIVLKPAGAIEGLVLDASTVPVAGAEVLILDVRTGLLKIQATVSDEDGRFVFADIPLGQYKLQASAGGFAPSLSEVVPVNGPPVTVVLDHGAALNGLVLRSSNRAPVLNMPLRLVADAFFQVEFAVASDEHGAFQVENLPKGLLLITSDDTHRAMTPPEASVTMSAGETEKVELLVEDGARISGRVYDENTGAPIPAAIVRAIDPIERLRAWKFTPTDEEGRYTLAGLTPGSLEVFIESVPQPYTRGAKAADRRISVELQPGESQENIDLPLDTGLMVCGVVVNERDEPVPGAMVSMGRTTADGDLFDFHDTRSGADGTFCFTNTWVGTGMAGEKVGQVPQDLMLEAQYRGVGRSESVWVRGVMESVSDLKLKLLPRAKGIIAGVVVDGAGKPALAALALRHPYTDSGFDRRMARTDVDGHFLFQDLSAGDFEIWMAADTGSSYNSGKKLAHALSLAEGQRVTDIRLVLHAGGSITGTLLDADRRPLRGVHIEAWDVDVRDFASAAFTDRDGRFRIDNLEGENFELRPDECVGDYWVVSARIGDDLEIVLTPEFLQEEHPLPPIDIIDAATGEERVIVPVKPDVKSGDETEAVTP